MVQTIQYVLAGIALVAFCYSLVYHLKFNSELEKQRRVGAIPPHLMQMRMGIGWMIGSGGLVPAGEPYRKRTLGGAAVFAACVIALMVLSRYR
jgi:hypothetical protein